MKYDYDVAVIGGGPAGLLAAGRAAELGSKVVLIEKNDRPGLKLLITGGGRCNITNDIEDPRLLAASYGLPGRFLLSAFTKFGVKETIQFFNDQGIKTKVEKDNQVFPTSDKATEVLNALVSYFKKNGGQIKLGSEVKKLVVRDNLIEQITLSNGEEIRANNYILATGGKSYPATGSTGDGYKWLERLGHKVMALRPALTPIIIKENFIKELEGLSLEKVALSLFFTSSKVKKELGAIIFTANGLSGPAAINLSRYIDPPGAGEYLEIDFFPNDSDSELDKRLQTVFNHGHKLAKNDLESQLPARLVSILIKQAGFEVDKLGNAITKQERSILVCLLKHFKLTIKNIGGFDKAIITVGGVELKEVDSKTMRSKIISNLFLVGEILDVSGPTGGYNLQICWSTGYVSGENAARQD